MPFQPAIATPSVSHPTVHSITLRLEAVAFGGFKLFSSSKMTWFSMQRVTSKKSRISPRFRPLLTSKQFATKLAQASRAPALLDSSYTDGDSASAFDCPCLLQDLFDISSMLLYRTQAAVIVRCLSSILVSLPASCFLPPLLLPLFPSNRSSESTKMALIFSPDVLASCS